MRIKKTFSPFIVSIFILHLLVFIACRNKKTDSNIAGSPQELQQMVPDLIRSFIDSAAAVDGMLDQPGLVQEAYQKNSYIPVWSKEQEWLPMGDSLYNMIAGAKLLGLFPEDYHEKELTSIRTGFFNDSTAKTDRKDAFLWSKADVLLTDAFMQIMKDVKLGRLAQDSITLRKDSVLPDEFYKERFAIAQHSHSIALVISSLEPKQIGYHLLKKGIKKFLDSADYRTHTVVPSPGSGTAYKKALQSRLYEGGFLPTDTIMADSESMIAAIKKFQLQNGITVDGQVGSGTLRMLNLSDWEKFIRIAISMDKYKMLPEQMPSKYIWVNLPGYSLQLVDNDTIILVSKIVCGKPITRTPQLTSAISEIITYPQWTIPTSIIVKEILPGVKKDPGYLSRKGFSLINGKGEEVDPFSVDWSKYSKGIPYRVVQGSGDANALGILKFNFNNKYSVYLHDTNQRYLFGLVSRDLSHGCVRVQEWQKLANYIIQNDGTIASGQNKTKIDSLNTWLRKKEKHSIPIRNRLPLFIRYFTCAGSDSGVVFYDDIYGEDEGLRKQYFATK
ncbi:MAG: L,D-transpeptidase family protein [Bacteroidia bacterium]|nr:L,D-transpeptidase family protein [Bacteroidia bacterium]